MQRSFLLFCLFVMSFSATSQWYDAQGIASTQEFDNETARKHAIENAVQKALLVAGASVSSVQQVVDGLLTQDQISIRASGIVSSLELVSETYENDHVIVNIRADIFPQEHQCPAADYRKKMLITKASLANREQANIGQIYKIDTAISKRIQSSFAKESRFVEGLLATKHKTQFSRLHSSLQIEKIKQLTISLADVTDSQFVMYIDLQDISIAGDENHPWRFWEKDEFDRNFSYSVFVYDGVKGEEIFAQEYAGIAPWTFDKRANIDVNSDTFWQSEYGEVIQDSIIALTNDLDEQLMCERAQGKIVQVNSDNLLINLGRRHGLKIGDELMVLHHQQIRTDTGKTYAGFNISPHKVSVTQVNKDSARAMSTDGNALGSVQINDVVIRVQ